ncbi:hypothetical protein GCM10017690_08340 [Microbacterium terregens]
MIQHPNGIVIGGRVVIGAHCTLLQQVTLGEKYADGSAPHLSPTILAGATIGAGAKVVGHVTVGAGSTVGANSVVTRDVPDGFTVVGVPAAPARRANEVGPAM